MIDIALCGGGLNPIGRHHENLACQIFDKKKMHTWFMPCFNHKFAKNDQLAPAFHRWAMTVLSCKNSKVGSRPCGWEIENEHSGAMYDTMAALKKKYPQYRFHIVLGMDNANIIETKWYRGKELVAENPFIVIERRGVEPSSDWFNHQPHCILTSDMDGSSTDIRYAVYHDRLSFLAQSLDPDVLSYIGRHQLYFK